MLTRKYYRIIAKCIKDNTYEVIGINKDSLVNDLAIEFKADNHLFNRDKFINACKE